MRRLPQLLQSSGRLKAARTYVWIET